MFGLLRLQRPKDAVLMKLRRDRRELTEAFEAAMGRDGEIENIGHRGFRSRKADLREG